METLSSGMTNPKPDTFVCELVVAHLELQTVTTRTAAVFRILMFRIRTLLGFVGFLEVGNSRVAAPLVELWWNSSVVVGIWFLFFFFFLLPYLVHLFFVQLVPLCGLEHGVISATCT